MDNVDVMPSIHEQENTPTEETFAKGEKLKLAEGLDGITYDYFTPCVPVLRGTIVDLLLSAIADHTRVLIRSSPSSGKTSVIDQIVIELRSQGRPSCLFTCMGGYWNVLVFNTETTTRKETKKVLKEFTNLQESGHDIFFFDDIQLALEGDNINGYKSYSSDFYNCFIRRNETTSIVCCSNYVMMEGDTNKIMFSLVYRYTDIVACEDEAVATYKLQLQQTGQFTYIKDYYSMVFDALRDYTNGQLCHMKLGMGHVENVVKQNAKTKEDVSIEFVRQAVGSAMEFMSRGSQRSGIVHWMKAWGVSKPLWRIILDSYNQECFDFSNVELRKPAADLVRMGVMVVDGESESWASCKFISQLVRDYMVVNIGREEYSNTSIPLYARDKNEITTLDAANAFILACSEAPWGRYYQLKEKDKEAFFQQLLFIPLLSVSTSDQVVHPEFRVQSPSETTCSVDVYINGAYQLAIEYLICENTAIGQTTTRSSFAGHVHRFTPTVGIYSGLPRKGSLVVAFTQKYIQRSEILKWNEDKLKKIGVIVVDMSDGGSIHIPGILEGALPLSAGKTLIRNPDGSITLDPNSGSGRPQKKYKADSGPASIPNSPATVPSQVVAFVTFGDQKIAVAVPDTFPGFRALLKELFKISGDFRIYQDAGKRGEFEVLQREVITNNSYLLVKAI